MTDLALIAPSVEKNDTSKLVLPTQKTFMVYGGNDDVVPVAVMKKFGEDFGIRSQVVADTGHFFHGKLGKLIITFSHNF